MTKCFRPRMSVFYTTKCPKCFQPLQVNEGPVGRSISCPLCRHQFRLESFQAAEADSQSTMAIAETRDNSEVWENFETPLLRSLGRFEVKAVLGEGGFGRVYLAYDPYLDRLVALKVPLFGTEDKKRCERFLREGRAQSLLRHDTIVPAYECGEIDGSLYIVFQYIEGQSLSSRIQQGRVERRQAVEWVRDVAHALAFAHANEVVHRDVKPHNILIDPQGRPFITDFGLARRLDEECDLTKPGSFTGTIPYIAPELLDGIEMNEDGQAGDVYRAVDQYSLGVVLFELLTGHRPFEGRFSAVAGMKVTQHPPRPSLHDPTIPRDLEAICLKAIQRHPKHRYHDCAALADTLTDWLTAHSEQSTTADAVPQQISTLQTTIHPSNRRHALRAFVLLPILVICVAAIIFAWPKPSPVLPDPEPPQRPVLLDLTSGISSEVRQRQREWAEYLGVDLKFKKSIEMQFCLIPAGKFVMGTSGEEHRQVSAEVRSAPILGKIEQTEKAHTVEISTPFFMSQFEVTQEEFESLMGTNPSVDKKPGNPVENVTYFEAVEFCEKLSDLDAGHKYRLPGEAEWEFARRAGGDSSPGALGLHNMLDGVTEWCSDWFAAYEDGEAKDPGGPQTGAKRVVRGGFHRSALYLQRPGHRDSDDPESRNPKRGFRIILEIAR